MAEAELKLPFTDLPGAGSVCDIPMSELLVEFEVGKFALDRLQSKFFVRQSVADYWKTLDESSVTIMSSPPGIGEWSSCASSILFFILPFRCPCPLLVIRA